MASIRQLYVALSLRAENFNQQIREAQAAGREFQRDMAPTTRLLNDIGSAMTNAGSALTVGLTLPIAGFGALAIKNFSDAASASALLENAIRTTGGVAGVTAQELQKMASSLQLQSLFDDDEIIRKVMTNLLTFTNIGKEVFGSATQGALNLSTVLQQDLQTSAIQLGKALNDPIAGVTALQRVGIKLSESQKELVKDLVHSGDIMSAQKVILQELSREGYDGMAAAAARAGTGPITVLNHQISDLTEKIGEVVVRGIAPFIERISQLVQWVDTWSDSTRTLVVVLGGVAAAIGPILYIMGSLATNVSSLITLYARLAPVILSSTTATTAFGVAMTALPWVAATAGITALILLINELSETYRNNKEASENIKSSISDQSRLIDQSIKNFEKYGIHIDKTGKSLEELRMETTNWNNALRTWTDEMKQSGGAIEGLHVNLEKGVVTQQKHIILTDAERKAMEDFRKAVDAMKLSVTGSQESTRILTESIKELEQAHVPAEAIAKRLAGQLKEERDRAADMGRELPPLVEQYYNLSMAIKSVKDRGTIDIVNPMNLRAQEQAMRQSIAYIGIELDILAQHQEQASNEMYAKHLERSSAIRDITVTTIEEATNQLNQLGALAGIQITKEQEARARQIEKVWTEAAGNITSSLANGLADVIFSGANFGKTMIDIAKQTARSMFEAFVSGLLSPLTSALGQLGANLGAKLFGGVNGPGILGGLLGGIFKGGGVDAVNAAVGPALSGPGGTGIGGLLGLGGGAGLLGLGAATIPVLGGAAFGVYELTKLFGRGRRTADEFVQNLQNPFGDLLAQVKTKEELESAWATFNDAANQFAAQGSTEAKVVRQAHNTLDPLIENLRRDLPAAQPVVNNYFDITQQPEQDTSQLINDIIRYLQGSSTDAARLSQVLA